MGTTTDERRLTTTTVLAATGVTYRQVDYWTRQGVFEAIGVPAAGRGSGSLRSWPANGVELVRTLARLARLGAGTRVLTRVVEAVAERPWLLELELELTVDLEGNVTNGTAGRAAAYVVSTVA